MGRGWQSLAVRIPGLFVDDVSTVRIPGLFTDVSLVSRDYLLTTWLALTRIREIEIHISLLHRKADSRTRKRDIIDTSSSSAAAAIQCNPPNRNYIERSY